MKMIHSQPFRILGSATLMLIMLASFVNPNVIAQTSNLQCPQGVVNKDCPSPTGDGSAVDAQAGAFFARPYKAVVKGGYVAHGVGLRDTGYGTIEVSDVPPGSTVVKAYLYWAIMGPKFIRGYSYNKGFLNKRLITGSFIGAAAGPCWSDGITEFPIWAYRADVKSLMSKGGNGVYDLSGFASGLTGGQDPFDSINTPIVPPLIDGASLVIIYSNPKSPVSTIHVYNGATTSFGNELHLNMPGFNTMPLSGITYTTFIGADGQSNAPKVGSTFFTTHLSSVAWNGTDPNGAGYDYSYGNLWDTTTVDVHSLVNPPEPDFWATMNGGDDCLTWVAQVVSYSSGNQDTDGDGLKDGWEVNGYSSYNDGYIDVNLPAMGADPLHKDLFVEADYMPGHLMDQAHLDDIVSVFNNAPISNPDGTTGVHIHIDTGGATTGGYVAAYDLGGGNQITHQNNVGTSDPSCFNYDWTEFQGLKNDNFYSGRTKIFHYTILAHNAAPACGSMSGISRNGLPDSVFIQGATDFLVTLGGWPNEGSQEEREGTFIHELGHNLGLRHGGNDHINYKPDYLSVMNYFFQTWGVYRDGSWYHFDYSRFTLPSLNESSLNEVNGLGPQAANYGTRWVCPGGGTTYTFSAGSNIDWNCNRDGGVQTSVAVNINGDGGFSTLGTQNNWASITFKGGGIIGSGLSLAGLSAYAVSISPANELNYELNQQLTAGLKKSG